MKIKSDLSNTDKKYLNDFDEIKNKLFNNDGSLKKDYYITILKQI